MKKYIFVMLIALSVGTGLVISNRAMAGWSETLGASKNSAQRKATIVKSSETDETYFRTGIFPPGFEKEIKDTVARYEQIWGAGQVEVKKYRDFTLIVPPNRLSFAAGDEKEIDSVVEEQKAHTPSIKQQRLDRRAIEKLFGTVPSISYDMFSGAYVDENGYQYNVTGGVVLGKSIGVTQTLQDKWREHQEKLVSENTILLSQDDSRRAADRIIALAGPEYFKSALPASVKSVFTESDKAAFNYGNFQILVDRRNGEIIHFSRNNENKEASK